MIIGRLLPSVELFLCLLDNWFFHLLKLAFLFCSGLAAAYKLKLNGIDVTVYEADSRAGGKIKSNSRDGFIWDEGANTMTETEADVGFLLDSLKIRDKQQLPLSQHKRYIAKDGSPMLLPSNPIALVGSSFLSTHSKFQVFLEPFLWKKSEPTKQESIQSSVGNFFQRHFGKEVVDNLVNPFIAGTTGGDPESLSMCHTFPDLWNLEKRYGSIISGAVLSKVFGKKEGSAKIKGTGGGRKRPRGSFSFLGGMQTLTDALCEELGKDVLKLHSKVLEFSSICNEGSSLDSWSISHESPGKKQAENKSYDAVIVTAPLSSVKDMKITKRGASFPLDFIPEINYISMSVITTAFRRERVERPLEGFGVLIPSKETQNGLKTLGTLFSSMMFPDRAPRDMYLYTTFVGGTRNRELTKASWDELKGIVL
ncbi:hypothetical protein Leryth_013340 [Lithospermum erythrorhizon]|nr:hypothetical protein Leryth_013340 [Lithospermum erythrorhizon]